MCWTYCTIDWNSVSRSSFRLSTNASRSTVLSSVGVGAGHSSRRASSEGARPAVRLTRAGGGTGADHRVGPGDVGPRSAGERGGDHVGHVDLEPDERAAEGLAEVVGA